MPPAHQPSSLTLVYLVRAFHILPPITPFWPYGSHPFCPHDQTISILSDLLYSLASFLFQLSCTSSFPTLSIHDTPTKLLKHSISRTFTFLLSALLIHHASAPHNAIGTITHSYRHFFAYNNNNNVYMLLLWGQRWCTSSI